MRVLHIDTGRTMRGGQWQALRLTQGLRQAGIETRLFSRIIPDSEPLRRLFASGNFHLVHAHDARAHTLALLTGLPVVVSRRVAFPVRTGVFSRYKYARAAHYIAVSRYVAAQLAASGIPETRITTVYDGVPVPAEPPGAGQSLLALDSDDPAKCRPLMAEAAALAETPLHFTPNLEADLPSAAAFLYLTKSEGLGSALLLAMAHQVPVIASNVGGIPEIVDDGQTGLLTSNEPHDAANGIRRLMADPSLRARLATNARASIEQRFTVGHMVKGTLAVYARVLDDKAPQ